MATQSDGRIAVDIGGTFTDVALEIDDQIITAKTLTTGSNPIDGVLDGIHTVLTNAGKSAADIGTIIHGTTLAANALIERKGARVGFITTSGFRDILEIAYERRYDQYDLLIDKPEMLVGREHSWTVPERIDATGAVVAELDDTDFGLLTQEIRAQNIESIAVCLLHSYVNPVHERRVGELLRQQCPGVSVTLSSDICPEIREYDRACTTVANAYVKPLMESYLAELANVIGAQGIHCALFIMTSGGGMTTLQTAIQAPIRLVESGPSGGAILASQIAEQCGSDKVVSFDMGGTTAKLCLIEDFAPHRSRQFEIARAARFIKGSGIPVRIPVIEMIEIGAGGGSVARIDPLGRIAVGPESAGSDPGPVCFGNGGSKPTVTDSDLVLGYLDPDNFADGRFRLDRAGAKAAVKQGIGDKLGLDPIVSSYGISQIVDESMANAARVHAAEWGQEIGGRTLIAFGGNGPLHASRIADKIDISRIIVPKDPGVGSAVGFLSAPVSYEIVRSLYSRLSQFDVRSVANLFDGMEHEARAIVRAGGSDTELIEKRVAFMRYDGQGHELEISVPTGTINTKTGDVLRRNFEVCYEQMFGRLVPDVDIEIINWAFVASTESKKRLPASVPENSRNATATGHCEIYLRGEDNLVSVSTFARSGLAPGDRIAGPALITEAQTTTLVDQGFEAVIDSAENIIMTRNHPGAAL